MEPRQHRDLEAFEQFEIKMERAMDTIVNDYHAAFNSSIHTFSNVVENIRDSHKRVRDMKTRLQNCKKLLHVRRSDIMDLWTKSVQYKEMIRLIDTM